MGSKPGLLLFTLVAVTSCSGTSHGYPGGPHSSGWYPGRDDYYDDRYRYERWREEEWRRREEERRRNEEEYRDRLENYKRDQQRERQLDKMDDAIRRGGG